MITPSKYQTSSNKPLLRSTISHALIEGTNVLAEKKIDAPLLTAELLLAYVLHVNRTYLMTNYSEYVPAKQLSRYRSLIKKRARRFPLQYITRRQEFWGLDFLVNSTVLIPRPETEFLVEQSLSLLQDDMHVVDVGTGSGCIAIALAAEKKVRRLKIRATDISSRALSVAKQNARRHRVLNKIQFYVGDLFRPLARFRGAIDMIICNPPYVSRDEFTKLQPEVRNFEPRSAITDDADGLQMYRRMSNEAHDYLKSRGYLVLELAYERCQEVIDLFDQRLWSVVRVVKDLQRIPRCLILQKIGALDQ